MLRATDTAQIDAALASARTRAVDLENRCQAMAASSGDQRLGNALLSLGLGVTSLRGALETNVSLRKDPNAPQMQELLQESAQTVSRHRQTVGAASDEVARLIS